MQTVVISRQAFEAIAAQAEREFPFECCGFIIGDVSDEVRPIRNIQNEKHAADPAMFQRDARTAYLMEPREHLAVLQEIDRRKLKLKAVYHSHPDHDAYFSATDRAQACSFDPAEPDYPETAYIVMSVRDGKFAGAAAFVWDTEQKGFVEAELRYS
ncbi:MAG: M67 family metallopeptidase [Deltaproteobacteria bacterium]|nr:M67 family metallopeptidase [Deltaproteobacteria bacterium]